MSRLSPFFCGQCGHEVESQFEAVQSPGTHAILEEQEFDIQCSECGWQGVILGKHRLGTWKKVSS